MKKLLTLSIPAFLIGMVIGGAVWLSTAPAQKAASEFIVFGLDGGTFYMFNPLLKTGRLPVLNSLIRQGVATHMKVDGPLQSPIIWTSIATGHRPQVHGVTAFTVKARNSYLEFPVTRLQRKTAALWNMFSRYGKSAGVINWWATWPAERINGYILTNNLFYVPLLENDDLSNVRAGLSFPTNLVDSYQNYFDSIPQKSLRAYLERITGSPEEIKGFTMTGTKMSDIDPNSKEFEDGLQYHTLIQFMRMEFASTAMLADLMHKNPTDVTFLYLQGLDPTQHFFWKWMEPRTEKGRFNGVDAVHIARFGRAIRDYYSFTDDLMGNILDQTSKEKTVMVLSDHGFRADFWYPQHAKVYKLNNLFELFGWLKHDNKGNIDWSETRLYTSEQSEFWSPVRNVYVNLKGREPKGIVDKRTEYRVVLERMKEKLLALRTSSGKRVFQRCIPPPKKNQHGEDWVNQPDMIAILNSELDTTENFIAEGKEYPLTMIMLPRYTSGNHNPLATFVLSGKNVAPQAVPETYPKVYDVAPTILMLNELPYGKDMAGTPQKWCVTADFLQRTPVNAIGTYAEWYQAQLSSGEMDSATQELLKDSLRGLGYIN